MSRFFSDKYSALTPYTPGEQPQDRRYIKLNTNESPYPPSPVAVRLAREEAGSCMLYSDPQCRSLRAAAAEYFDIGEDAVVFGNGSDEVLNFAFSAMRSSVPYRSAARGLFDSSAGLFCSGRNDLYCKSECAYRYRTRARCY